MNKGQKNPDISILCQKISTKVLPLGHHNIKESGDRFWIILSPARTCRQGPAARILPAMSDEPQQPAEWLTYAQAAERLGLRTPNAAAARARRGRWQKRFIKNTGAAEILVPGELLARPAPHLPVQQREAPPPTSDAPTVADAVRAAVGPLEAALERQELAAKVLQAALDFARAETAAAQLEAAKADTLRQAAELGADDLARRLEREENDRRTLQRQADAVRLELHVALSEAAKSHGENHVRQAAAEARVADLERQIAELTVKKSRRWWQF